MNRIQVLFLILLICFFLCVVSCGDDDDDTDDVQHGCVDDDDDNDDNDDNDDDDNDDDNDDNDDDDNDTVEPITLDLIDGCNPFSTSEECFLPYPSSFYQEADEDSATGVRVNYPDEFLPVGEGIPQIDMGPTNLADGVSPAGPILMHFGIDVDPEDLNSIENLDDSLDPENPIALFDVETGRRIRFIAEMDMNRVESYPDRYAMIIRPMEPMEMGHRHVVVLTDELSHDAGTPFESPEAFAVLRDGIPVTNTEIEDIRNHYEGLFTFIESKGYTRGDLYLVWDFMVASQDFLLGSVLSMRETTLNMVRTGDLSYTITAVIDDPNEYVARIVEGDFEVPAFLRDDNTLEYDGDHHPIIQDATLTYPFTMVIPKLAHTATEPLPLVVFGHGIFGSGRSYLNGWAASFIHPIAQEQGAVLVATDWIGLSSGDLDLIINEVLPDLNRITLVTDRLQQSLINNLTLTELTIGALSHDDQVQVTETQLIDPNRIYYYGVSLGGIQGSSFVSISNRITRGVLAVPGSVWLNMIPRSTVWVPIKIFMDLLYPDPLTQQLGIAVIQTRFDHSDPINLTKLLYKAPLPDAPLNKKVVLQESIGDCQVPNMTTEMLARAIGINLVTPSHYSVPGLPEVTSPTTESAMVQYYLKDQVEAYSPPEENVPPEIDNNVHSDMVFLSHVVDQVTHFIKTGELVQYCDGECDPD